MRNLVVWFENLISISQLVPVLSVFSGHLKYKTQTVSRRELFHVSLFRKTIILIYFTDKHVTPHKTFLFSDYCTSGLRSHGGNANRACCVFPFQFRGVWHDHCTKTGYDRFWCSTTTIYEGDFKWGLC